jgi:fatty acid-binding protein DegV
LLVVKAGEMIRAGFSAPDIQKALSGEMRSFVSASFILDTLEFMAAGGRCKSITAFGANLLRLKPCIEVDNLDGGNMKVGKLYRGSIEKVLPQYVKNKLENCENIDFERIFITHSGSPKSDVDLVRKEIAKYASFRDIYVTEASGTICSHCGPRTLGILFMRTKA